MGFLRGFLFAIPVGLYFGEKKLDYPICYVSRRNHALGYLKIDF